MPKAVLHALSSSEVQDTPFLVVLILPVWDDTPWNSTAIRGHHNMATLIRIPAGHMRFVPAHKQSDVANPRLSPAKWPVELVLIANEKGRETFICHDRIHRILSPTIQATCLLTTAQTLFLSISPLVGWLGGRLTPTRRKLLPTSPATPARSSPLGPATPQGEPSPYGPIPGIPTQRLDTHSPATHHVPPWEPAGIGTTHEVASAIITTGAPVILGPMHSVHLIQATP